MHKSNKKAFKSPLGDLGVIVTGKVGRRQQGIRSKH